MTGSVATRPIVLAIDDEMDNLELISRCLVDQYDVKIFTDPALALKAAMSVPPVAVIVDYRMPNTNGIELIGQLRNAGIHCAAVMTTGYPSEYEVQKGEEDRLLFRVLPKPWNADDLRVLLGMAITASRVEKATSRLEKATGPLAKKPG